MNEGFHLFMATVHLHLVQCMSERNVARRNVLFFIVVRSRGSDMLIYRALNVPALTTVLRGLGCQVGVGEFEYHLESSKFLL
ncbi:hypothetical protein N7517_002200 [Penicillium concentricum]|uniref:Uncharacterized protein n=1 Tax=Penicillium concentricum TaxID=293559 RepID=A0A9W9SVG1_9EURO|nr:uncharacterized protein N7517_002200 [Penicillium concentricum]KAJ5384289.1 hypothetical protein N7517_002200 [Penicillium concentricum]